MQTFMYGMGCARVRACAVYYVTVGSDGRFEMVVVPLRWTGRTTPVCAATSFSSCIQFMLLQAMNGALKGGQARDKLE